MAASTSAAAAAGRHQILPHLAVSILLVAVVLQQLALPTKAFLFPDLKFRTGGSSGGPKYRIAVMQEEPYLYANGSGYMSELVRDISRAYRTQHGASELQFEMVPVHSWQQLLTRARSSRWQLALGLVIPSLDLTSWGGRQLQTSAPTVYTTLKMVMRRQRPAAVAAAAADWEAAATINDLMEEGADQNVAGRRRSALSDRSKVIVLRGSPIEYLLLRGNNYRGPIQQVETMDQAVSALLAGGSGADEELALLTDAVVADHLAASHPGDLEAVCPSKLAGSGWLYYGFFGRDASTIQKLNEVIAPMMADDSLLSLYSKRLGSQTQHCPW
jgi:hypothetical protein